MSICHLTGLIAWPVWVYYHGAPQWEEIAIAIFMYALAIVGINFGYHRGLSHQAFKMSWPLRFLALFGGASAAENSALAWCSDHRRHHRYEDTELDPYNIKKGFWWAHMGWIFASLTSEDFRNVSDLQKDPMIRHQHKYYALWLGVSCFLFPLALGFLVGRPVEVFLLAGFTRLMLVNQFTYLVNSWAHYFGSQPYSTEITARESMVVAVLASGEGYHNFHHRFPFDYRNGHKWYHWDPVKWFVYCMSKLGLVHNLKMTPATEIYRARIQVRAAKSKADAAKMAQHNEMIEAALRKWHLLVLEMERVKKTWDDSYHEKLAHLRSRSKLAKREFKEAYREWKLCLVAAEVQ